jgi:hypothetical protein
VLYLSILALTAYLCGPFHLGISTKSDYLIPVFISMLASSDKERITKSYMYYNRVQLPGTLCTQSSVHACIKHVHVQLYITHFPRQGTYLALPFAGSGSA